MSEITKACKTCNDTRKVSSDAWEAPPAPCPDCERTKACGRCNGTGVNSCGIGPELCPDCGGACSYCSGTGRVTDVEATLRAQLNTSHIQCEQFESALRTRDGQLVALRAEVARLTKERNYARNLATDRLLANNGLTDEVARLTATLAERDGEVARLEGREAFARPFVERNDVNSDGDDVCPACGSRDPRFADGAEHVCPPPCPRAAWLAGCKP